MLDIFVIILGIFVYEVQVIYECSCSWC